MGPLDLADLEELKVKQGQRRDKIENAPKDKAIQATDKAHKAGNITDREHIENLKNAPNFIQVIEEAFGDITESGEVWDESRQQFLTKKVAPLAQKVDDSLTNITGQNWIGDRSRNVINFGADILAPTSGDLAVGAAVLPLTAADGPLPFGDAAAGTIAGLKYGSGVTGRLYKKTSQMLDDVFDKRVQKVTPVYASGPADDITSRIENALKVNKDLKYRYIPEEKLDKSISEIDRLALVTKDRIRKYVKEFGGNEADVNRILKEQKKSFNSIYKANAWLNDYFKQLSEGLPKNITLRDVRIADINGVPKLVNKNTGKGFPHAFEVDHRSAKVALGELGIEGADIWENLDVVYTVFNRAKNTVANNPMIPREFSQALGESTSLREFVGRRMSKEFNSRFTKIPQEVRELVRESMIQDLLSSKGSKGDVKRIVARQVDLYSNPKYRSFVTDLIDRMQTPPKGIRIEQYDAIMEDIEVLLRHIDNKQHQLRYEELIQMPIWHMMPKVEQIKFINLHDQYVTRKRGLGAQFKSKQGKYYGDRDDV